MRRRLLLLLGLALPPAASQRRVFIAQGGVTDLRKGPLALGVTTASLLGDPAIYRANFLIENAAAQAVQFEQLYETLTQPERGGLVGTGNGTAAAPEGAFSRLYDAVGQTMSFDVYFDRSIEETIYVGVVRAFQVPNPLDPFGGSYTNFYGQYAVRVQPVANDNQYNLEMSLLEDGEAWTAEWGPIKFNSFTDWITIERTFRDRVNLYLTTLLPGAASPLPPPNPPSPPEPAPLPPPFPPPGVLDQLLEETKSYLIPLLSSMAGGFVLTAIIVYARRAGYDLSFLRSMNLPFLGSSAPASDGDAERTTLANPLANPADPASSAASAPQPGRSLALRDSFF